jgi:hypothetical protein
VVTTVRNSYLPLKPERMQQVFGRTIKKFHDGSRRSGVFGFSITVAKKVSY